MGILYNALNDLIEGAIGLGIGQVDKMLTRAAEEGKLKEQAAALDQFVAEQYDPYVNRATGIEAMQSPMSGGVLPIDRTNNIAVDYGRTGDNIMQNQVPNPQFEPYAKMFGNSYTAQLATNLGYQIPKLDPRIAAAEMAKKQQEAIIGAAQSAAGTLGGKGNIGNYDIGPYIKGTQQYSPQNIWGNAAEGAATVESAKFPEWQKRHDISVADQIRVKQTPGARAIGSGEGDGGPASATSLSQRTSALNEIKRRKIPGMGTVVQKPGNLASAYQPIEVFETNDLAERAADIFVELRSKEKKPNENKIFMKAIQQAKKEFNESHKPGGENFKGSQTPTKQSQSTSQPVLSEEIKQQARDLIEAKGRTPEVEAWLKSKGIDPNSL